MIQRPSSVVVVPNGSPLGCLRKDMVSDLVFEVWIMVSQIPDGVFVSVDGLVLD